MLFKDKIIKRLMPIYLGFFFKGMIFWYAIEKLFMTEIGFGPSSIAVVSVVMGVTGLLLEIPFGVLADRWSRKGMLILSVVFLGLATWTLGMSDTVVQYTLASIFFGVYIAMFSGTVDSIVYDTLLEENGNRDGFEKYYGYTNLVMSVSLIAGTLIGGVIAVYVSLTATYFLTIPSIFLAIIILMFLKEPKLHKQQTKVKIFQHTQETFGLLLQKGTFAWVMTALVCLFIIMELFYELDQLWLIALAMPLVLYGPVNALFLVGYGAGGPLASLLVKRKIYIQIAGLLTILMTALLSFQNLVVIIISITALFILIEAFYTIGIGKLHDEVPSKYRSGISSSVSTLGNIIMIPSILIFGFTAEKSSIFSASYLIIPLAVIAVISMVKITRKKLPYLA